MLQLPGWTLGSLAASPLALLSLPFLLALLVKPVRGVALLALFAATPLLLAASGPGLVGGVVVFASLLRAVVAPQEARAAAQIALLWLPAAFLQPPLLAPVGPGLVWSVLGALAAALGVAAALQPANRWPLSLLLALLPFAPFGDALLRPAQVSATLSFADSAARWSFAGPGALDVLHLSGVWFLTDRLARGLLFGAILLGWVGAHRGQRSLRSLARVLTLGALVLLLGQTVGASGLAPQAPGFPHMPATGLEWNGAGVALGCARVLSLLLLLRVAPFASTVSVDAWAGATASLTLAVLALAAPSLAGPTWLVDSFALALVALLLASLVRGSAPSALLDRVLAFGQLAAAAVIAGGVWAGWATASVLQP